MRLWDSLLGRRKQAGANLDALFALPSAAITLQAAGFEPTGVGSVCFRAAEGAAFAQTHTDLVALLDADAGPAVEQSTDEFGFSWLVTRHDASDVAGLVTDVHAVNTTLEAQGFGPGLLCSLVGFTEAAAAGGVRRVGLVYLYKQGTFYPFVPRDDQHSGQQRDNLAEIRIRDLVSGDLPVERDLSRWMPVWGAPGL